VLLIDEVLSVGDMAFQEKCVERMKEFKRRGVAIVFVSHNLQAVTGLCERALYLCADVRAYGPTGSVLGQYVATNQAPRTATGHSSPSSPLDYLAMTPPGRLRLARH